MAHRMHSMRLPAEEQKQTPMHRAIGWGRRLQLLDRLLQTCYARDPAKNQSMGVQVRET